VVGGYARVDPAHEAPDQVCRAVWALERNDHGRVAAFAQAALDGGAAAPDALEACLAAAISARRTGCREREGSWLDRALARAATTEDFVRVRTARAKFFEHRARQWTLALAEALELAEHAPSQSTWHRVARLERKLGRVASPSASFPPEGWTAEATAAPSARPEAPPVEPERSANSTRLRSALAGLRCPAR